MSWFWNVEIAAFLLLQILVVLAITKGAYRKYPFLFVYCLASFVAAVAEDSTNFLAGGFRSKLYVKLYWIDDAVLKFLILLMVLSLIYRALERRPNRATVVRMMAALAIIVVLVSYYAGSETLSNGYRLTRAARNLSFFAALSNLVLWGALLGQKDRDRQLLLIVGALGIQLTGEAIGHSIRQFVSQSHALIIQLPNLIVVLSGFACWWIWWRMFSRHESAAKSLPATVR